MTWDTEETLLWVLNDEGLYCCALHTKSPEELKELLHEIRLDVDYDNVDWQAVYTEIGE